MASQYHRLTKVFSILANSNPRLNIWDRMSIISSVNDYFISSEEINNSRFRELENKLQNKLQNNDAKINNLTNEIDNLKNKSCNGEKCKCI